GGITIGHRTGRLVDALGRAPDETYVDRVEQRLQGRCHVVHVGFVEARADMQFGLGCEHGHLDIVPAMLVQQAYSAQGAPQASESCTDNQNLSFHVVLLEKVTGRCIPEGVLQRPGEDTAQWMRGWRARGVSVSPDTVWPVVVLGVMRLLADGLESMLSATACAT